MAACTPAIHVFLGSPLFLLFPGIQSIINKKTSLKLKIKYVRAYRRPNCGTDHKLLVANMLFPSTYTTKDKQKEKKENTVTMVDKKRKYIYTYIYLFKYVYIYIYIDEYICIYMCVCVYIFIYIYIYK